MEKSVRQLLHMIDRQQLQVSPTITPYYWDSRQATSVIRTVLEGCGHADILIDTNGYVVHGEGTLKLLELLQSGHIHGTVNGKKYYALKSADGYIVSNKQLNGSINIYDAINRIDNRRAARKIRKTILKYKFNLTKVYR